MKWIWLLYIALSPLQSWAQNCAHESLSSLQTSSYSESSADHHPQKGYVLVFHGLNLNPDRMGEVTSFLNRAGFETLTIKLTGHGRVTSGFSGVTYSKWYQETAAFICAGRNRAMALNLPLFLVGYSLGGVVSLNVMIELQEQVTFRGIVLLAPAIKLRWRSRIFGWFAFLPDSFMITSRSPKFYRANKATSLGAYRAMYNSIDEFGIRTRNRGLNAPVLVLMNPDDGLVSWNGLRTFVQERRLIGWDFYALNNHHSELEKPNNHLIIDAASLGEGQWMVLKTKVLDHFINPPLKKES